MKIILQYIAVLPLFILSMQSCDDSILGDAPGSTPIELFDQVWTDFDVTYSHFPLKTVDWDSVYSAYRPRINNRMTDSKLFDQIGSMLNTLEDGHVDLFGMGRRTSYMGWFTGHPKNYYPEIINERYLASKSETTAFTYGILGTGDYGYIYIKTFGGDRGDFETFGDILSQLNDREGLVIDVRNNGGGSTNNSETIIRYFADSDPVFSFVRYKNGPGHNDFTDWKAQRLNPGESPVYLKPVVVLTNRRCYSTTESFILSMRVLPNVTVAGDTTGGGAGNPIFRELANGWTYRVPRWQQVTVDRRQYEGIGLFPDIPAWITPVDSANGRDAILEAAVNYLDGIN